MAKEVKMPKLGMSVESCIITQWHKSKGDIVRVGEALCSYETDKSSNTLESPEEGVLLEVFFGEGADVPVMEVVCVIGKAGEKVERTVADDAGRLPSSPTEHPVGFAATPLERRGIEVSAVSNAIPPESQAVGDGFRGSSLSMSQDGAVALMRYAGDGKVSTTGISPRAKAAAARHGVDASGLAPTGAEGRVCEADVLNAIGKPQAVTASKAPKTAAYEDEKLTGVRKAISKAMHASLSQMAQVTLNASFDATAILAFRASLKAKGKDSGLPNVTLNDMVMFAVSRTLLNHRYINAHFLGDSFRCFNSVNLGMAVDTEKGLLVPTIADADSKSLAKIAAETKQLADKAVKGTISPDEMSGGTFTVTNLGTLGIESFTPVINPPQTAILGVCNLIERVRVEGGKIGTYQAMGLSLTFDHRAVDGAPAGRFLKELCFNLENFSLLLL